MGALDGAAVDKVGADVGAFEGMKMVVGAAVGRKTTGIKSSKVK